MSYRHRLQSLLLLVLLVVPCRGQTSQHAVIRITSHGASGTVVQTSQDSSYILTCAHAFRGADRTLAIRLDVPVSGLAVRPRLVRPRIVALDYRLDLALIHLAAGPLPYVCAIAPASALSVRRALSVGYDEMKLPPVVRSATVLDSGPELLYTQEKPWHGRSGGALINGQGQLIGVVQGYEVSGQQRGIYASPAAIAAFLRNQTPRPQYTPPVGYNPSPLPRVPAPGYCPPGRT